VQADLHVEQRDGREGNENRRGDAPPEPGGPLGWGHRVHARREVRQRTGVVGGVRLFNRVLGFVAET